MKSDSPDTVVANSLESAARKAVLPFRIIEEMGVACGYERSFKMLAGRVLANRYLLGIDTDNLTSEEILAVCRRLDMPTAYRESFAAHLAEANLVFLGFEDNEEAGCMYRMYLEFWEKIQRDQQAKPEDTEPALLHLGFKWHTDDNTQRAISRYMCYPLLSLEDILHRLSNVYADHSESASYEVARDIVALAGSKSVGQSPIYVEVFEDNSQRRSFDINLYGAGLRIRDLLGHLSTIRLHYCIPDDQFRRLYTLVGDKLLGHLSGGINREGSDFLTFYYEAQTDITGQ